MIKWIVYTLSACFAVYWASNLMLWFPWSYNAKLGMTLMLTVSPILWGYATFLCLKTYPKKNIIRGALGIAFIFLVSAVVMDYIFFGLIRNSMEALYHPTTLYGYGFVLFLPFIIALLFKKRIKRQKKNATNTDIIMAASCGMVCFGLLTLIIVLGIEFDFQNLMEEF